MAKDIRDMTVEELDAEIEQLMAERAALSARQREIVQLRDEKAARLTARRKVESFTDAERAALAGMISPEGIVPEEAFGHIGVPVWLRRLLSG